MKEIFKIGFEDKQTKARTGLLLTPHGVVTTPVFMPVGTQATIKAIKTKELRELGISIILANTYHLWMRPGPELIEKLGGLHKFMDWERVILTDSGGYQVYSLSTLRKIKEDGVEFRSHIDGSKRFLTPKKAIDIQKSLGSDIVMPLDECTPFPASRIDTENSLKLTLKWARISKKYGDKILKRQILFGIIQGGFYEDLRKLATEEIVNLGFSGYAIGGMSVGEPKSLMFEMIEAIEPLIPKDKPRYLMGVGKPLDLVEGVSRGIDMFDCVIPTRNARNGMLFTSDGYIIIKHSIHSNSDRPIDENCKCFVCQRYSRAYLRHLFMAGEILASQLNTYHNLYFYIDLMRQIRQSIQSGFFYKFLKECREKWKDIT